MTRLIYLADPMCSWCYGFGPQLSVLLEREAPIELRIVMGGLRAYNKRVMDAAMKMSTRDHWQHVHEASGLPFSEALFARDDFIYDTEPACRGVVTVRAQASGRALDYFHAVQKAFYAEGRDVTQADVLADCAVELGVPRDTFLTTFHSDGMKEATRQDFALTQRLGVTGFPTLLMEDADKFHVISLGFASIDALSARIAAVSVQATL
jgi:putative protein-disulfide isomerase